MHNLEQSVNELVPLVRLWRHELSSNYWNFDHSNIAKMLIKNLTDQDFREAAPEAPMQEGFSSEVEFNSYVNFPGYNMELFKDRKVSSFNKQHGGVLCSNKEILFVELKGNIGFTYMYSNNKDDFLKCKN